MASDAEAYQHACVQQLLGEVRELKAEIREKDKKIKELESDIENKAIEEHFWGC